MTTSTSPTSSSNGLAERLAAVREGVTDAARAAGRSPEEITTIVVTKFHPASLVRELAALGVRDVGENRHQEAQEKAAELADLDLRWHFVGQLQSKKARQARRYASVIHSVDRLSLVDALASDEAVVDAFVQLNLTDDPARGGVADGDLEPLVEHVLATSGLRLLGVMAVAPLGEEPARAFERVRAASERVRSLAPEASAISAGMSQDYREAIAAGATHLRIGTAITGNRPELR
ncbi:YggS family pyridoxal phosphate-dependent enzyme [Leifsonia sp. 2MCAF36]|uniref:YggS family pyridoxal phosphate-dependent enzyme n=1 Tax=Leifsonia sp. 2MCAF36 TaxID=3232988 RepID=UPI003F9C2B0D